MVAEAAHQVGFCGSAIAVGAALFNVKVAVAVRGILEPVSLAENVDGAPLPVTLSLGDEQDTALVTIYEPILARRTNRHHGKPTPVPAETIDVLYAAAAAEGALLHLADHARPHRPGSNYSWLPPAGRGI